MARVWSLHGQGFSARDFGDAEPDLSETGRAGPEPSAPNVEVRVIWGGDLLAVRHLAPGRCFRIGEHGPQPIDFVVPEQKIGGASLTLLDHDASGPSLYVPPGAQLSGAAGDPGAGRITLRPGSTVRVAFEDLGFEFTMVSAGRRTPRALLGGDDRSAPMYFGLSLLSVGALVFGLALSMPPFGLEDDEQIERERLVTILQILNADAERERAELEPAATADSGPSGGETAAPARGESGTMGKLSAPKRDARAAFEGEADRVVLSREEALAEARTTGMIGLLATMNAGHPLNVPWGASPQGMDALDAVGNSWGRDLGDAFGSGGLNLSGTGDGGGGDASDSIGLIGVGTCSTGVCSGLEHGIGRSHARGPGGHAPTVPRVRMGVSSVSGTLAPEVVQRIVRQNFGRFRMCYEQGLQKNPNLEGRVAVRFVIDRSGAVSSASNGGSDLPDANVVECVVRAYYGLSFPSPENGIVTVRYPIMFSPG